MVARYKAVITLLESGITQLPITSAQVENTIKKYGWNIIEYSLKSNVHIKLLDKYNVLSIAERSKAFTYKHETEKIIFIRSNLSANDKRMLLTHELGHIVLGHMADNNVLGYKPGGLIDEGQEDEANEFALEFLAPVCVLTKKHISTPQLVSSTTLLDTKRSRLVADEVHNHKKYTEYELKLCNQFSVTKKEKNIKIRYIVVAIITATILITATITTDHKSYQENMDYTQNTQEATPAPQITDVIVTKTGQKYHNPNCSYIKNKTNLIHMTADEAIQAGYQPCEICISNNK